MALSGLFAIRGFLAFVAFMEFVNALRSLFPSFFALPEERLENSFIQKKIFSNAQLTEDGQLIVSQLFGFYSLLNSIIVFHAAIFCHYLPIISLCGTAILAKTCFYVVQGFYGTIPATSGLQVPLFISLLSLAGVVALPYFNAKTKMLFSGDENQDLLKQMKVPKKRKQN